MAVKAPFFFLSGLGRFDFAMGDTLYGVGSGLLPPIM